MNLHHCLSYILFFFLVLLFYGHTLPIGLHADDFVILSHLKAETVAKFFEVFSSKIAVANVIGNGSDYFYRPLTMAVLSALGRDDSPQLIRSFALLMHFCNVCLVYRIAIALPLKRVVAVLTSVLFCFHPATTTALLSIAAIGDVLLTFFALMTTSFLVTRKSSSSPWRRNSLALCCYLGSLLSKETALILPFVWFLVTWWTGRLRKDATLLVLFFVSAGSFFILRGILLGSYLAGPAAAHYHGWRSQSLVAAARYLYDLLIPVPLDISVEHPITLLSVSLPLLLFTVAGRVYGRRKFVSGCTWTFAMVSTTLLPVLHHYGGWYTYISTAVLALGFGYAFNSIRSRVATVACALFLALSINTLLRQTSCFYRSGQLNKTLIAHIAALPIQELSIAGVPKTICSTAPLFTWNGQLTAGLKLLTGSDQEIHLLAQPVLGVIDQPWIERNEKREQSNTPSELSVRGQFSYFSLSSDEMSGLVIPRQYNLLYKPNRVTLHQRTTPLYLWRRENQLERIE